MYHPKSEELVDILVDRTGSDVRPFFRNLVAFYMASIAAMMRTNIRTQDRDTIPVNLYALNLAHSGIGKNYASNTLEEICLKPFEANFRSQVFNREVDANLKKLIIQTINHNPTGREDTEIRDSVYSEFEELGDFVTTFDSATSAAIKQLHKKLVMANAGALNLIIDEVGSNITGNVEALTDYLTLFDKGIIKSKITKSTKENRRGILVDGPTPANLLMFGTPARLINGGRTEEEFFVLLETGYARRLLFAYVKSPPAKVRLSPDELYNKALGNEKAVKIDKIVEYFANLADYSRFNMTFDMSKETLTAMLVYKQECEIQADNFKAHQHIHRVEMAHRYYKALKIAGTYAFIDGAAGLTTKHLEYAIQLVEDSGDAFQTLMNRDRNYVKLARYLADIDRDITHADLTEDLPFYGGGEAKKRELMNLAIAYGYKNNIVIQRSTVEGIEFFKGESLVETDIDKVIISYSSDLARDYESQIIPFSEFRTLTQADGYHWCSHEFRAQHRTEDNAIKGFNLLVLDVDKDISLELATTVLEDYHYHIHTTKRHTLDNHRFRIVLPLSHTLKLDADNYKAFMANVFHWLPFPTDTATAQRSRKWVTHKSEYYDNTGTLLDATQFIPQTRKAADHQSFINEHSNLTGLERWFIQKAQSEGRNNMLLRYGFALIDQGHKFEHVHHSIFEFNEKLSPPINETEINDTVLVTLTKKLENT